MPIKKRPKSKLPPINELSTTKEPAHSGRSAIFFPILDAKNWETQFSAQWTMALDFGVVKAMAWFNEAAQLDNGANPLNESELVRYALAWLAYEAGCREHPIPALREIAIERLRENGFKIQ